MDNDRTPETAPQQTLDNVTDAENFEAVKLEDSSAPAAPPAESAPVAPPTVPPSKPKRGPSPRWICEKGHAMLDPVSLRAVRQKHERPKFCVTCERGETAPVAKVAALPPPAPTFDDIRKQIGEGAPKLLGVASMASMPVDMLAQRFVGAELAECRVVYMRTNVDGVAVPVAGSALEALTVAFAELAAYAGPGWITHPIAPACVTALSVVGAIAACARSKQSAVNMVPGNFPTGATA